MPMPSLTAPRLAVASVTQVPLEEWPTYIFTRVYAQHSARSELYDSEIAALKAVAQRADARKVVS